MYFFTDIAQGKKARYDNDPKRNELKTKAEVVTFVKQCVKDGADLIKGKGDKGLKESVNDGSSRLIRLGDLAYGLIRTLWGALRTVGGVLPNQRHGSVGIAAEKNKLVKPARNDRGSGGHYFHEAQRVSKNFFRIDGYRSIRPERICEGERADRRGVVSPGATFR